MESTVKYIILFFFYSIAGWCLESLYCSIGEKRFVNRGFLTGPLCPIYGTAALILTVFIYNPFKDRPLIVFFLGILLCDILEYLTSYIMEKLFSARWWDYTYEFLNIQGRICLKHTLYWGIISVVFVNSIHPFVDGLYEKFNTGYMGYVLLVLLIIFTLDVINAVRKALDIRKLQIKLANLTDTLSKELSSIKADFKKRYGNVQKYLAEKADKIVEVKYQIDDVLSSFEDIFIKDVKPKERKSLSNRLFYNNPTFERLTKNKLEKLQNIIDDIKANIYEGEEMQ